MLRTARGGGNEWVPKLGAPIVAYERDPFEFEGVEHRQEVGTDSSGAIVTVRDGGGRPVARERRADGTEAAAAARSRAVGASPQAWSGNPCTIITGGPSPHSHTAIGPRPWTVNVGGSTRSGSPVSNCDTSEND